MGYPFVYALEDGETPSDEVADQESAEDLIEEGTLTDETMCWNEDMDAWTEWARCKGEFGFVQEAGDEEEEYDYEYYTVLQYQTEDGQPSDEIDTADVAALIEQGEFNDESMCWTEGMDDWYPWGQCKVQFGFDADDDEADGAEAEAIEAWLQGMDDTELKEQCEMGGIELGSWDTEAMRDALREMYGQHGEAEEDEDGEITSLIYEKEDGSYSDEVPLAEAWELAEGGTITDGTLCWAEGLDDWAPWHEAKHWFFDLEDDEAEAGDADAPAEGVPGVVAVVETAETAAAREKFEAMRPYQVKNECKKRKLPSEGAKPELIEALVVFEFGGGAKAAKEMAEAAKAKADEEAQKKKDAKHAALIEAERTAKEEETNYLKKVKADEAEKKAKGKTSTAKPEDAMQELGYSRKSVQQAMRQSQGDQAKVRFSHSFCPALAPFVSFGVFDSSSVFNLAGAGAASEVQEEARCDDGGVSKTVELCIKNEELCIKKEEFCI